MKTRQENIEAAAKDYQAVKHSFSNIEDVRWTAFVAGAQWADFHEEVIKIEITPEECLSHIKERNQAQQDRALAVEALNKIGIAQMGPLDYTTEFFELTKNIVRDTLERLK